MKYWHTVHCAEYFYYVFQGQICSMSSQRDEIIIILMMEPGDGTDSNYFSDYQDKETNTKKKLTYANELIVQKKPNRNYLRWFTPKHNLFGFHIYPFV